MKACGALSSLALGTSLTSSSFDTGSLSISSLVCLLLLLLLLPPQSALLSCAAQVQLLDASDPEAAENASMALWTVAPLTLFSPPPCKTRHSLMLAPPAAVPQPQAA